ncbi:MAG: hypothetical protein IJH70_02500 [Oscillospiraceae bacterium]|nr:hypothetical protein [Oscillospiraceae bacterium]
MTHVKLSCGFEADIDETRIADMEFMDAINDIQEGDLTGLSKLAGIILPKPERKKLYDCVRNENGLATIDKVGDMLFELLDQLGSKKK